MSMCSPLQWSLKEACSDCRDCCGPLIITCSSLLLANLFCSMHTQMNINAMEDDSHVWMFVLLGHTDADTTPKVGTDTQREGHAHSPVLRALPSETVEPPLQLQGGRGNASHRHTHTRTHSTSFLDTLSQRRRDGERKESVLSEINREIIP